MNLGGISNLDLLSVGITVAAIGVLGFIVLLTNRKSITSQTFFLFSIVTLVWGIVNYLNYQKFPIETAFWFLKITILLGVFHAFSFFQLAYVFPNEKEVFPRWYKFILIPWVFLIATSTLTPLIFHDVASISADERIAKVNNGPGIAFFGITILGFVASGIFLFVKKTIRSLGLAKKQFLAVLIGVTLTFSLLMTFNFILPAFFDRPDFIPLGALFILPFIICTAYAIFRHGLLNIKIIGTEILAFFLSIVVLYEVIFSENVVVLILRSGIFVLVLGISILLIRSVRKEVEQREKLQKLTEDLSAANTKLTELDRLKSEFLNFASHQVKSPMAVVKGFAELIADGTYGQVSDEAKEKAKKIKENADRTLALVGNLLDLGKIEAGKMDFNFGDVDIVTMTKGMAEEYKVIATAKGLDLQFETALPSLKIKADEQKIRQVIQNVIDNSIKYTPQGFIKVKLEDHGDYVLISVVDSGRGMSQELVKKLFGRFVRDEKTKLEIQGTGLGLYLAKQIVDAHHGKIWAESDGEGKGSRFYIRLAKQ
jgi:signal transduction histidine kinase